MNIYSFARKYAQIVKYLGLPLITPNFHIFWSYKHEFDSLQYLHNISLDRGISCIRPNSIVSTNEYDLQIIVPVYNGEKFISNCLNSILSQVSSYSFIVSVINDGSTDETAKKLKHYDNNPLIQIIHQQNTGHSGARNAGLRNITGKYIMFVDSDDTLNKGAIEALLSKAYQNNSDIVEGAYRTVTNNQASQNTVTPIKDRPYGYPWGKIYRSDLFYKIHFPEGYWFEDTIMEAIIYQNAKRKDTVDCVTYNYTINPTGVTQTCFGKAKILDSIYLLNKLIEDRKKLNLQSTQEFYDYLLRQIVLNFIRTSSLNNDIVSKCVFDINCKIFKAYKNYNTADPNYKPLEQALRNGNYLGYYMACHYLMR